MFTKRNLLAGFLCLVSLLAWPQAPIKVACIGNSITYGYTLPQRETQAYPVQLQKLLGNGYQVGNFGKSGATLLNKGHRPYMQQEEFRQAMAFAADIAVIHLGINDTDPRNWPNYRDEFVRDYLALIDSLHTANANCRIIISRLSPISHRHPRFESGTRDWRDDIQQAIQTVAQVAQTQLMDWEEPLYPYPHLLPDALHPTAEGAAIIAGNVYAAITGNYGGLQMPMTYTDHMVLQRNKPLPIRGRANAGSKVKVSIGQQTLHTTADSNGHWCATLEPMEAGGPYTLTIADADKTLRFTDVLVGEVWFCSGQSNMEFRMNQTTDARTEIAQSDDKELRLLDMKGRWLTYAVEWPASVLDSLNHLQYFAATGWEIASPQTVDDFSAVAYHFGKMLRDSLQVPVGLICNAVGGSPTEAWIDRSTLEHRFPAILHDWTRNDFIQDWVRGRAALNVKRSTYPYQRHPYEPCYLYEAGIRPLHQFPLQGVIWYQGESNAHNAEAHEQLFRLLIDSWRNNWDNKQMPVYFVQLSGLNRPSWPWFRNSQRQLASAIPHTGMAVSSDHGDSLDVHPRNKKPIGQRLARLALHHTYQQTHVVPSGPQPIQAKANRGAVYLTFEHAEGMHSSDGKPLRTFEVAEFDGLFEPATAVVEGNRLKVKSSKVKHPRYVRYGWQPFTRANLVNESGLPASTFKMTVEEAEVNTAKN